jgi:hypothetical protein
VPSARGVVKHCKRCRQLGGSCAWKGRIGERRPSCLCVYKKEEKNDWFGCWLMCASMSSLPSGVAAV